MQNIKNIINQLKTSFLNYKTETLVFRPFVKSDCFPLYIATQSPGFNDKLWWSKPNTPEDLMVEVLKLIREHDMNQSVVISTCDKNTGKWAGVVKFTAYQDSITMSLWLHPDYWNSRTPIRCAESAIEIIFSNTNLPHIYARITKDYPVMEKIVSLNGFEYFEETTVQHAEGHYLKSNTFKLSRENWQRKTKVSSY